MILKWILSIQDNIVNVNQSNKSFIKQLLSLFQHIALVTIPYNKNDAQEYWVYLYYHMLSLLYYHVIIIIT